MGALRPDLKIGEMQAVQELEEADIRGTVAGGPEPLRTWQPLARGPSRLRHPTFSSADWQDLIRNSSGADQKALLDVICAFCAS